MNNIAQLGNYRAVRDAQKDDSIFFPVEAVQLQDILDPGRGLTAPDQQAVIRTDTNKILHIPKSRYHLTKNSDIFPLLEEGIQKSSIDMSGMKVADSLAYDGGMTVRTYTFPGHVAEPVVGDITQLQMKVINSYNGGSQFKCFIQGMRLACLNGMVLPAGIINLIGARHTKSLGAKLPEIIQKMVKALEIFNSQTAIWETFTQTTISDAQAIQIIQTMPGMNERLEQRLKSLWLDHKQELGATKWALYNTLTYWSTHEDIRPSAASNVSAIVLDRESKVQSVLNHPAWLQAA